MRKGVYRWWRCVLCGVAFPASALVAADSIESGMDAFYEWLQAEVPGKFGVNSRLRYEMFDLDNGSPRREGVSHRNRYGYTSVEFSGVQLMAEGETVWALSDPDEIHPLDDAGDGTDLNQAWVSFSDGEMLEAKIGRQVYTLDDHRFIGHVGWRQNMQSFDAATVAMNAAGATLRAFYFDAVNAVDGSHHQLDAVGLNLAYSAPQGVRWVAFYYGIEGRDLAAQSNDTLGMRVSGSLEMNSEVNLRYSGSIATQESNNASPSSYEAIYLAGELAAAWSGGVSGGAGFEILEPHFRTPLATVHKFNGFADALLPLAGLAEGLEDYYLFVGSKIPVGNGVNVKLTRHWFEPETENGEYGTEWDLVASYEFNEYLEIVAKWGQYESDGGSGEVGGLDKSMGTVELNFTF